MSETTTTTEVPTVTEIIEMPPHPKEWVLGNSMIYDFYRGLQAMVAEKVSADNITMWIHPETTNLHMSRLGNNHATMTEIEIPYRSQGAHVYPSAHVDDAPDPHKWTPINTPKNPLSIRSDQFGAFVRWYEQNLIKGDSTGGVTIRVDPRKRTLVVEQHRIDAADSDDIGATHEIMLDEHGREFRIPDATRCRSFQFNADTLHLAIKTMKASIDDMYGARLTLEEPNDPHPSNKSRGDTYDDQYLKIRCHTIGDFGLDVHMRIPLAEQASPPLDDQRVARVYSANLMSAIAFRTLIGTSKAARSEPFKQIIWRVTDRGLSVWDFIGHNIRASYWVAPLAES